MAVSFFRLFGPLAAVILLVSYFYGNSHRMAELGRLQAQEALHVQLSAGIFDRRLQAVVGDLRSVAGGSALMQLLEGPGPKEIKRIEEDFLSLANAKRIYAKIRWIDQDGQEVVRVDFKNGQAKVVDRNNLQNEAARYYFAETMALAPGRLYVSPLDLSVTGNEVDKPHQSILRVATPVADRQGNKRGMLILNYLSDQMIGYVEDITEPIADHLMIINADGYFLLAPNKADEWGFMFNKPELTLSSRYPDSWPILQTTEQGQFDDKNGLWTVASVSPLQADHHLGNGQIPGSAPSDLSGKQSNQLKIISRVAPEHMPAMFGEHGFSPYFILLFLALSAGIAYALARSRHREDKLETRFRIYFEHAMVGMAVNDVDKRWRVVNPALCKILGYREDELIGRSWSEFTHPDDRAASNAAFDKVIRGESDGYELQKRFIRADGQVIDVVLAAQAVRKPNGQVDCFLATFEDITARLLAENALRASEERLRMLGDNLPESYVYQCAKQPNGEMKFIYVSSGIRGIHGIEPEALLNDPGLIFQTADPAQLLDLFMAEAESERTLSDFSMELHVRRRDGDWGWLLLRSRPRQLPSGEIIWNGVATDITERRKSAALLDLQSRRAGALLELPRRSSRLPENEFMRYALDLIKQMTDSRFAFMYRVNEEKNDIELLTCSTADELVKQEISLNRHHPISDYALWAESIRDRQVIIRNDPASASHENGLPLDQAALRRLACLPVLENDRVQIMIVVGDKPSPYNDTDVETMQLLANETWRIVGQQRAERALLIATQVVNASPVVCFRWQASPGWPAIYVSDNVAQWGYTVEGLLAGNPPFSEMVHPDDLSRIAEEVERYTAEGRSEYVQEYRLLTADKQVLWVTDRTSVLRNAAGDAEFYDGILSDITERRQQAKEMTEALTAQRQLNKRLEEAHNQLLQSEKMASIGQLAAGIAHELNNPIGFVHSNLGTLEAYLRDVMEIIDAYDLKLGSGDDAAASKEAMNRLREQRDFNFVREDIVQLLAESKDGLSRVRKIVQDLKSFSHVSEQEWQWADLHQGLDSTLNIVWNELKYKCKVIKEYGDLPKVYCLISQLNQVFMNLLVNAGHAIEKQGTITLRTSLSDDETVCIEVIDSGKGIAPEHLSRIFEPFFTTKAIGKGTGLGLSLSYGIIDKHHGKIEVDSIVGTGTTFRILIPIHQATGETAGHHPEASR
jgi:PAS domain S-box-containing protein